MMLECGPIIYIIELEELENWVKTKARIGDIALHHDPVCELTYFYHYTKPDDNPVWVMYLND